MAARTLPAAASISRSRRTGRPSGLTRRCGSADRDPKNWVTIWDSFGGAEYNVNFKADTDGAVRPYLYTGAAGERLVSEVPLDHAFDPARSAVEFAVPLTCYRSMRPAIRWARSTSWPM